MNSPNLILDKLKADGSHYVVVSFDMPQTLGIPDDNYPMNMSWDSNPIKIQIILENRNSTVKAFIPVKRNQFENNISFETAWAQIKREYKTYLLIAVNAINRLLGQYRHLTGEFHIKLITTQRDFNFIFLFNELPPGLHKSKFTAIYLPVYDVSSSVKTVVEIPIQVIDNLKENLIKGDDIKFAEELMLNSYDFLEQGNYRMAVVEAETAFEVAIQQFVRTYYRAFPNNLQTLGNINSFMTYLKHPLTLSALSTGSVTFQKGNALFDDWEMNVWKVRGNLVHGKEDVISYNAAIQAIGIIENVLEKILRRDKTALRRYAKHTLNL